MSHPNRLNVVLYWHMHQPEYRDLQNGHFQLPWTYLHAIKDYVDMVAHLENNPQARAVVNFAPVLLEQIAAYSQQLQGYQQQGEEIHDPLLNCLSKPKTVFDPEKQKQLIKTCSRANKERLIDRFDKFRALYEMAQQALQQESLLSYYSQQFYADLLVWYHLAWLGETVRNSDSRVKQLMEKGEHFSYEDRQLLITIIAELIHSLIPRYKRLALSHRIELSMTPATHPILPLLLDFHAASEAMPDAPLPASDAYPGGRQRSVWQMQQGMDIFFKHFGFMPKGCWPSEGSISDATVALVQEMGLQWLASGETVLRNSLNACGVENEACMHKAYRYQDLPVRCYFRDDGLSDLIGFEYSSWHADDAVANLIHHLENIAAKCSDKDDAIVSIILDGENAWEYYPFNGYYFLDALYRKISEHEYLNLTTFSEHMSQYTQTAPLQKIVAGSWVYGTFSTWIGEADKNRAWDLLVEAKKAYDQAVAENRLSKEELAQATAQLATCESSDWFWWFGDYNAAESVASFDQQFRMHLRNLYRILHHPIPDTLLQAVSQGCDSADLQMGGVMLPGKQS